MVSPTMHYQPDTYGHARLPAGAHDTAPGRVDKIPYGRFRNVYLYITEEACQLRCRHCYMGGRLERALKMPLHTIVQTLTAWRQMGGSKLTILGGEPTLHPQFSDAIRHATVVGYEHVITTSNGLDPAIRKFRRMTPEDFAHIQISLDGGSATSHDRVRGNGTFDQALRNVAELVERGFDTRIICTVNRVNAGDCLNLLDIGDEIGVSLVKFHVFSVIGSGHGAVEWGRNERKRTPMRYRACIDVHLILRRGEELLLGQRQNTGFADDCWHMPSGHTEDGESATAALIREVAEEIGVNIDLAEVRFVHLMHHRTNSGRIALFFEVTRWNGEPTNREPDKCAGWAWFPLTDLPADMIPYAAQVLVQDLQRRECGLIEIGRQHARNFDHGHHPSGSSAQRVLTELRKLAERMASQAATTATPVSSELDNLRARRAARLTGAQDRDRPPVDHERGPGDC